MLQYLVSGSVSEIATNFLRVVVEKDMEIELPCKSKIVYLVCHQE